MRIMSPIIDQEALGKQEWLKYEVVMYIPEEPLSSSCRVFFDRGLNWRVRLSSNMVLVVSPINRFVSILFMTRYLGGICVRLNSMI